ncbi:MAG: hypothetical protein WCB94_04840 [Terriglobales bacterium]
MWLQYHLSIRASDDSQPAWAWYGSPISAALNFPAFVYSGPATLLFRIGVPGFNVGKLWIHPQIVLFFFLVIVHWYWIGQKIEHRVLRESDSPPRKPTLLLVALYGLGAALWILFVIGTVQAVVETWLWLRRSNLIWDREIFPVAWVLWSVGLSVYYSRSFVRALRVRARH